MNNTILNDSRRTDVLKEIDIRMADLALAEVNFAKARVQIGILLNEVRANQYWKEQFGSFDAYLESLETRFQRKRTQCYAYAAIVRDLLPVVGEEKLTEMGLEKAKLLCTAKKTMGFLPEPKILDMAADSDVTTKQFRQVLLNAKKIPDQPSAKFYNLEYAADAERQATIEAALVSVKRTEQLTGSDEVQMGAVLEILSQEYLGSNSESI